MIKSFEIDDLIFDKRAVEALRDDQIAMRDAALCANLLDWVVSLSHCIAFLGAIRDEME